MARGKNKHTFTVVVYYSNKKEYEIRATDRKDAEEKAHERCMNEEKPVTVDDMVVESCDYSSIQEEIDRDNEGRI